MKIKDVDKMAVKDAIDYTMRKLVAQGRMCQSKGECVYGSSGSHCAIGWLLNENNNNVMSFRGGLIELLINHPTSVPKLIRDNKSLFILLQNFHDSESRGYRTGTLNDMKENYPHAIDLRKGYWQDWISIAPKR